MHVVPSERQCQMCPRRPASGLGSCATANVAVVRYLDDGAVTCVLVSASASASACWAGRGQLTSSFEDLSRALGAIGQRKRDNLIEAGEFDLSTKCVSLCRAALELIWLRTLSRMTRGPLMPPMVLYRTRGWTDIMRGSRVAMLAVLMSDLERWVSLKSAGFAGAKGGGLRDLGDEVEVGGKLVVLQLGRNVSARCTHMTRLQPQGSRQPTYIRCTHQHPPSSKASGRRQRHL